MTWWSSHGEAGERQVLLADLQAVACALDDRFLGDVAGVVSEESGAAERQGPAGTPLSALAPRQFRRIGAGQVLVQPDQGEPVPRRAGRQGLRPVVRADLPDREVTAAIRPQVVREGVGVPDTLADHFHGDVVDRRISAVRLRPEVVPADQAHRPVGGDDLRVIPEALEDLGQLPGEDGHPRHRHVVLLEEAPQVLHELGEGVAHGDVAEQEAHDDGLCSVVSAADTGEEARSFVASRMPPVGGRG